MKLTKTPQRRIPNQDYEQLKSLGYNDNEIKEILKTARKSQVNNIGKQSALTEQQKWEIENNLKPESSTDEQMKLITQKAIEEFGLTDDMSKAVYMLPNGEMLDGTYGQGFGRAVDHRDIGSAYVNANVDIRELNRGGNTHNMEDFMRYGNIRIMPENKSIELYQYPTNEQLNQIVRQYRAGNLDEIEFNKNYLNDIESEQQIYNFFRKLRS